MKPIFGTGKATAELLELVKKVAPTDVSICIQGESGSGKEVLARQIHELSNACVFLRLIGMKPED